MSQQPHICLSPHLHNRSKKGVMPCGVRVDALSETRPL